MSTSLFEIIIPILVLAILIPAYLRLRLKLLKTYDSKYSGKITIHQKYNGERVMAFNSFAQGLSIYDKGINQSYWYKIAEEVARASQDKAHPKLLMLGLGAVTTSHLVAKLNPKIAQTIVEIDPMVVDACQKYFELDKLPNYSLELGDVFEVVKKNKKDWQNTFDAIVVDIYSGEKPFIVESTNEADFINTIYSFLKKDGMITFNRPAHNPEIRARGEKVLAYLEKHFYHTRLFDIKDPRGYRNYVLVAKNRIKK